MVRFQPEPDIPVKAAQDGFDRYLFARERRSGIHRFLAALPHPVCNPPFSGLPNNSKPLQMRLLQRAGFRVPEWLVTNDAARAEEFAAAHGDVIVKALSGMRSQVRAYGDTHRSALAEGTAPFVMQRRIKGPNVRVHTFGAHCFATRIESPDMIDYRFETGEQKWSACEAPPGIAQLCRDYVESEGLIIGGLDFLVDEDGWWCLECNPAPTFITYEFSAKQPIADALVRHLLDIPSGTRAERVA
jgi:glutathione synthase/RimK-type ligase-like ATP-grasp enzyme